MSVGYQYGQDTAEQSAFEHDFPYELTPDQSKSIDEIKGDMEKQDLWTAFFVVMWDMVKLKWLSVQRLKLSWMVSKLRFSTNNDSCTTTLRNTP